MLIILQAVGKISINITRGVEWQDSYIGCAVKQKFIFCSQNHALFLIRTQYAAAFAKAMGLSSVI
jgi:hypothetical protein